MLSYDSTMVSVRDGLIKASIVFFSWKKMTYYHASFFPIFTRDFSWNRSVS